MVSLTMPELWLLKDVEQQLVDTGTAVYVNRASEFAPIVAGGYLTNPNVGQYDITPRGLRVLQVFRRFLALNRVGGLPPFPEPPDPVDAAEQVAIAREIFIRAMTLSASPPPAPATADACIAAAGVFINRRKLAGL